jgi:signal transduction histidine kinase
LIMFHNIRSPYHQDRTSHEERKDYLYREIEDRKHAEEALKDINHKLQLLSETAIILNAEKYTSGFYADISHKLKELTGGSSVTLSIYDPTTRCINVRYAEMEESVLNDLYLALGGRNVTEVGFPVSDDHYQLLADEPIRYFDSLSEATFGLIPRLLGKFLQKVQGIDRFIGISYFIDNELFGISLVAIGEKAPDLSDDIIQSYARMVSVAFKRKKAEEQAIEAREETLRLLELADRSRLALLSVVEDEKKAHEELAMLNEELEDRVSQRTSQLEMANKELEAFSYSVSHDLRAPLRAMDCFSKILLEDYSDHLNPEVNRILSIITENAKKMGHLIDDLLEFSRLGRHEIKLSRIDMKSLVKSVCKDLAIQEENEKIELRLKEIPDSYGDPSLIRQVFLNLIGNALKFSSRKPKIIIEVDHLSNETENIFFVRDNGAGFDMKYLNRLFGVFQRLHTVHEFEGTGVGLAIVQRIILRMGGRVWAEGKVNEGATFYFSLPVKP